MFAPRRLSNVLDGICDAIMDQIMMLNTLFLSSLATSTHFTVSELSRPFVSITFWDPIGDFFVSFLEDPDWPELFCPQSPVQSISKREINNKNQIFSRVIMFFFNASRKILVEIRLLAGNLRVWWKPQGDLIPWKGSQRFVFSWSIYCYKFWRFLIPGGESILDPFSLSWGRERSWNDFSVTNTNEIESFDFSFTKRLQFEGNKNQQQLISKWRFDQLVSWVCLEPDVKNPATQQATAKL